MSGGNSVKVAVRVRPFNDREKSRNAKLVIDMTGNTTTIKNPDDSHGDPKKFTFDYSYWSHDGFTTQEDGYMKPDGPKYADQQTVFNDLGRDVLDNAWKGFNCSLFAYGQTGSGKSYSMVGYGTNKGIVPIVCEELYKQIDEKKVENTEYQVTVSMLEIYCEKVRDLLDKNPPPKGGLKVREHPKKGFYVDGLKQVPVDSYAAIEGKIDEGTKNRTVAATQMNATSSRAHTIVQVSFIQKGNGQNGQTKSSLINLVDLAGSERQQDTGAAGDRLKEGIVINQSLTTLGRCIKALVDQQGGDKKVQVPFRESALTSLLKNALGGNSKTVMIAALSPADINYEETLGTLRFADRAKSIKTQAIVNESATDKLIRELREENAKLAKMLGTGGGGGGGGSGGDSSEAVDQLRRQLEANQSEMEQMEQSWQQRLAEAAASGGVTEPSRDEVEIKKKTTPHFWNLNEDPALTGMVVHFLNPGDNSVGSKKAKPAPDIQLNGLNIKKEHAIVKNEDGKKIMIIPGSGTNILLNGKEISKQTELQHYDKVLLGGNHLYVLSHPFDHDQRKKGGHKFKKPTYDSAQSEIAEHSGIMDLTTKKQGKVKSPEDLILEEDLIKIWPQVGQSCSMADELAKNVRFEVALIAPEARGKKVGNTEIYVKMINKANNNEFWWDKNKFTNRYYAMQEIYQNYVEGYSDWDLPKDRDPFFEPPDAEVMIGVVLVYLQSLAYMVEIDEQLPLMDFKGNEHGQLKVGLVPCDTSGKEILGEFVDQPEELIGENMNFKVKIEKAMGLQRKYISSRCKYKFYDDKEITTLEVSGSSPPYGHEKQFPFKPVSKTLVDYLKEQALCIEVWGKQSGKAVANAKIPAGSSAGAGGGDAYRQKAEDLQKKLDEIQRLMADNDKNVSYLKLSQLLGGEFDSEVQVAAALEQVTEKQHNHDVDEVLNELDNVEEIHEEVKAMQKVLEEEAAAAGGKLSPEKKSKKKRSDSKQRDKSADKKSSSSEGSKQAKPKKPRDKSKDPGEKKTKPKKKT